jgi:hypothetical protein
MGVKISGGCGGVCVNFSGSTGRNRPEFFTRHSRNSRFFSRPVHPAFTKFPVFFTPRSPGVHNIPGFQEALPHSGFHAPSCSGDRKKLRKSAQWGLQRVSTYFPMGSDHVAFKPRRRAKRQLVPAKIRHCRMLLICSHEPGIQDARNSSEKCAVCPFVSCSSGSASFSNDNLSA